MLFGTFFHYKQARLCFLRIFPQLSYLNGNLAFPEKAFPLLSLRVGVFILLPAQSLSQLFSYTLGHQHLTLDSFMGSLSLYVLHVGVRFSLHFLLLYSLPMWLHCTFPSPSVAPTYSLLGHIYLLSFHAQSDISTWLFCKHHKFHTYKT